MFYITSAVTWGGGTWHKKGRARPVPLIIGKTRRSGRWPAEAYLEIKAYGGSGSLDVLNTRVLEQSGVATTERLAHNETTWDHRRRSVGLLHIVPLMGPVYIEDSY
jgi:hypothetical protein